MLRIAAKVYRDTEKSEGAAGWLLFYFLELSKGRNHLVVHDFDFLVASVEKG
jgi:hypothetical protein